MRAIMDGIAGDHPRVCGEQAVLFWFALGDTGSPPRVRGTEALPMQRQEKEGITPACAGNSTSQALNCFTT